MTTRIRDMVQTTTISDLTPIEISSVSGPIYLNKAEIRNQVETIEIVKAFQAVHTPTFGAPIVGTFDISTSSGAILDTEVNLVNPSANQTYKLLAASMLNIAPTGSAESGDLYLSDGLGSVVKLATVSSLAAAGEETFDLSKVDPIYFTKDIHLSGVPTAGNPVFCTFKVAFCKVVQ
jgi:hypothetical protein